MLRKSLLVSMLLALSPAIAQPVVVDAAAAGEAVKVTAKIVAVNAADRTVTVVGPMGKTVTLVAGDRVKNFAQIKAGDESCCGMPRPCRLPWRRVPSGAVRP